MLTLYHSADPDAEARKVGTLTVDDDGTAHLDPPDADLEKLINAVPVTKSLRGEPVEKTDPRYRFALGDSIGRTTAWEYYVVPEGEPEPEEP